MMMIGLAGAWAPVAAMLLLLMMMMPMMTLSRNAAAAAAAADVGPAPRVVATGFEWAENLW
jgi:hypothetical protein